MDREKAVAAFRGYSEKYDTSDVKVKLKIDHTYRVCEFAYLIGNDAGADGEFCWFLGLLHDIGRFEQLRRFDTFIDRISIDHAELGADILFREGLIDEFPKPELSGWEKLAETAIRLHNKLELPESLDEETLLYTRVLRDADKCDIFRVLTEPPYDERNAGIIRGAEDGSMAPAREFFMEFVREHKCVPRTTDRSDFESLIAQCCMGFELYFPKSGEIVREQGYLDKLMGIELKNEAMMSQLKELREEMKRVLL